MPRHFFEMTAPAGTGPGTAVALDPAMPNGASYNLHFSGFGTGTTQVQISHDNVSWTNLGSAVTSNSVVSFNLGGIRWARLNNTAWTSGNYVARAHGRSPAKVYS